MSLASLCPYSSEMRPWHSLSRDGVRLPVESRLTLWFALRNWKQTKWHPVPSELKPCSFHFNSWDPETIVYEEAQCTEAHGNISGSCITSSPNCQASEWGCFGPRWAISDDYSHTNKWLKTFWGTSLAAQWLRLFFHCQSLGRELRSQMPCTAAKK